MSEADMREKTLADLSPEEKQLLQEAESYLRDKLRNSFEKVLVNCEKLDTQNTGTLDKDAFRTALSRSFACRLTDAEFAVFHLKQVFCPVVHSLPAFAHSHVLTHCLHSHNTGQCGASDRHVDICLLDTVSLWLSCSCLCFFRVRVRVPFVHIVRYHRAPKLWVRLQHRPIDLVKVRGLFHDMMGNNDLEDPATRKRAEQKKSEAVKYVKEQLRLNYKTILRCFRGLDLEGRDSLPLEQVCSE